VGVAVGTGVAVAKGVAVAAGVEGAVDVAVAVAVGDGIGVVVGSAVGVLLGMAVGDGDGVGVAVALGVAVATAMTGGGVGDSPAMRGSGDAVIRPRKNPSKRLRRQATGMTPAPVRRRCGGRFLSDTSLSGQRAARAGSGRMIRFSGSSVPSAAVTVNRWSG
jgi:hypothetical protein